MSVRPLIFAIPATAAFSLVAAAGLAWMSPASALDSGPDDLLELAQATPPTPPPAAGGPDRRDRPARQSQGLLPRPDRPPRRQPHLPQGPARPEGRADDGVERLRQGVRRCRRQGHGPLQRAADRDEGAAELRRSPDHGRERHEGARRAHRGGQADAWWPSTTRCRRSRRSCSTGRGRWAAWAAAGHHGGPRYDPEVVAHLCLTGEVLAARGEGERHKGGLRLRSNGNVRWYFYRRDVCPPAPAGHLTLPALRAGPRPPRSPSLTGAERA